MSAPFEVVDGETFEYFNNPVRFVQPHLHLFLRERRHWRRYKESMKDYQVINLRWTAAEDSYDRWLSQYRREAEETAIREAQEKAGRGE